MYDIEKSINREIKKLETLKPTVIFAEAYDERILLSSYYLIRYAKIVIIADENKLKKFVKEECPNIDDEKYEYIFANIRVADLKKSEYRKIKEEFVKEYHKIAPGLELKKGLIESEDFLNSTVFFAIMATKLGYADMVVGGLQTPPKIFFRPSIKILKGSETPFEAGVFVLPDEHPKIPFEENIAVFGDVGVTMYMTPEKLADIAIGCCQIARDLFPEDILPEIIGTIVSYSTKGSDEGPSVDLVRDAEPFIDKKLKKLAEENLIYNTIRIDTEVQVSYALSRKADLIRRKAEVNSFHKAPMKWSTIGNCNVVVAPNLDLGNFLYHLYSTEFPHSVKFPQMGGIDFKIVDFAFNSGWKDVVLGVEANILRMLKSGKWQETPNDYFFKRYKILAINPGSTSSKISLFEGEKHIFTEEIQHSQEEREKFSSIIEQRDFRKDLILNTLKDKGISVEKLDAIVGRGGMIYPVKSGTYNVNERMIEDLKLGVQGQHASNLGGILATDIKEDVFTRAKKKIPAFIVDPVVVNEVDEICLVTGFKEIKRKVISHALSQIASAKRFAEETRKLYHNLNLIVAHLGGGITVGAHHKGRYCDVNNGLDGEGPFSPERSGSIPTGQLIRMCYSGKYTLEEMKLKNKGKGGLIALLGTSDFREIEKRVKSDDREATQIFHAMAYQIAKEISSLIPAFEGEKVDQIILTGGLARSKMLVDKIKDRIKGLNIDVTVYPGENEMIALRDGALRVLQGKEKAREYVGKT